MRGSIHTCSPAVVNVLSFTSVLNSSRQPHVAIAGRLRLVARGAVHAVAHNSFTVPVGGGVARARGDARVQQEELAHLVPFRGICNPSPKHINEAANIFFYYHYYFNNQQEHFDKSIFIHRRMLFFFFNYFFHLSGEDSFSVKRHLMRGH